jgi:hypothetical protein
MPSPPRGTGCRRTASAIPGCSRSSNGYPTTKSVHDFAGNPVDMPVAGSNATAERIRQLTRLRPPRVTCTEWSQLISRSRKPRNSPPLIPQSVSAPTSVGDHPVERLGRAACSASGSGSVLRRKISSARATRRRKPSLARAGRYRIASSSRPRGPGPQHSAAPHGTDAGRYTAPRLDRSCQRRSSRATNPGSLSSCSTAMTPTAAPLLSPGTQ